MTEKTNDELLAMLAHPEAWPPEALDAAKVELIKRGVRSGLSISKPPDLPRPVAALGRQDGAAALGAPMRVGRASSRMPGWVIGLIVCGCVLGFLFIVGILAAMLLPALAVAKTKAPTINCVNNEKHLALALFKYADSHDGKLPPAATWCDAISSDINEGKAFKCPAASATSRCDYAFNAKLDGVNIKTVDPQTVLLFESDSGWNASGGPELLPDHTRHRGYVVAFADGSVQMETVSQMQQLKWNP